jgi:hypothetical protein
MLTAADLEEILARPAGRRAAMLLAGAGFAGPRQAAAALAELARAAGFRALAPTLLEDLGAAADPDAALAALAGLLAAAPPELGGRVLARLAADPDSRRVLAALLGSSRAFAATLARWPEWVETVIAPGAMDRPLAAGELSAALASELAAAPGPAALDPRLNNAPTSSLDVVTLFKTGAGALPLPGAAGAGCCPGRRSPRRWSWPAGRSTSGTGWPMATRSSRRG